MLSFVAIGSFAFANDSLPALMLDEVIDQALQEAPQVTSSEATVEAAQLVAPAAGRLPDPEFVTAIENLPVNSADRFSLTRDFMTMRKIGVMQSFPSRAKRRLQSEQAEHAVNVAEADLEKSRFETARAAAEAWIALAVAEERLNRLRELKPETDSQAAAARGALASGRTSTADALAAQFMAARLDERILTLEQEAQMKRVELSRWVGAIADRPAGPLPADREVEHSMDALVTGVAEHAPLAPFAARLAATRTEVELARAQRRPDWSTELSYAKRGSQFSDMVSLEVRVSLSLFSRNRQNPLIAGKLATLRAEEAARDAEVRMHSAEVQAAYAQWQRGRERLQAYRSELLPLARDRWRATAAAYGANRGDVRSTLDALTEEITTQLDYVDLQGEVSRAWVFLHLLHDSGDLR